jgi:2,4-dienoyl-CoA reductase-like NADH-dependent reductase (Old Yellow Enzyme family)
MEVAGRIFKTATSETRATSDGYVSDLLLDFYRPIARARTPLIITGAMYVRQDGKAANHQLAADSDDRVEGLRRLTKLVHDEEGLIIAQLNHAGRQVIPSAVGLNGAVSASRVYDWSLGTWPRKLEKREIAELVKAFADAAVRCKQAGFDGIQLQAAHGYLLAQFMTPHTNRRRDEYGVSSEGSRFLCDVYDRTRVAVGKDFPILLKINGADALLLGRGLRTAELVHLAVEMEERGVDAVEVSVGHYVSLLPGFRGRFKDYLRDFLEHGTGAKLPWPQRVSMKLGRPLLGRLFELCWPPKEGFNSHFAPQFKRQLAIPVICVGGYHGVDAINRAISEGTCDAVSIGRAMVADPWLYHNLRKGTLGPECSYCNRCLAVAGARPIDCYDSSVRRPSLPPGALDRVGSQLARRATDRHVQAGQD